MPKRAKILITTMPPLPMLIQISLVSICAGFGGRGVGVNGTGVKVIVTVVVGA
jgi:hypothetical protein